MNLYCVKDNKCELLSGRSSVSGSSLDYVLDKALTHGEYLMRITVSDRARNSSVSEYRFIVPEREIIAISGVWEEYEEAKHKKLFRSFLDERAEVLDLHRYRLYVYRYVFHNKAERTYCKGLYLSISNQAIVLCWKEAGSVDCKGIVSLNMTESMQKSISKNMIFTSERLLRIDEIGPGGLAHFCVLVGFVDWSESSPTVRIPAEEIGVFGTYISEGYGKTTIEKVGRRVPIERRNSGN